MHFVRPAANGNLLVVSTGLDMVLEVTPDGTIVREWSVLGTDPWERFSRQTDYRKVETTKPHASHPNYVIPIGDDLWVSRAKQQDVFCLTQAGRRVEFCAFPHDGVRGHGGVYFTTVNGFVYVLDDKTMAVKQVVDLNAIDTRGVNLGWARGIFPVDENLCWVGFSKLRPTKLKENLSWVKHRFKQVHLPTRVALYDFAQQKLLREIVVDSYGMNAIFSILPETPRT